MAKSKDVYVFIYDLKSGPNYEVYADAAMAEKRFENLLRERLTERTYYAKKTNEDKEKIIQEALKHWNFNDTADILEIERVPYYKKNTKNNK